MVESTPHGAWVIGRTLPGYLSESDTSAYAGWKDAYSAFVDMCREYADEDDEADWSDDDYGSMRATVDSILADGDDRDLGLAGHDCSAGMLVRDHADREISFWLVWSDDRDPDEDGE